MCAQHMRHHVGEIDIVLAITLFEPIEIEI